MTVPALAMGRPPLHGGGPSPFAAAYGRLAEVLPSLGVRETGAAGETGATGEAGEAETPGAANSPCAGPGWVTAGQLAAGGPAAEDYLAREDEQLLRDHGRRARPDVVATFGLHRFAWPVCLTVTMPWFLSRRVPWLSAETVSFHRGRHEVSVSADRFACLPDDPAAGAPGARVVPDEEALRGQVRSTVVACLDGLLEGFRGRTRRGTRALWGTVTDEITEGLWYSGHLLGEERRAVREAGELLPGGIGPYARGAAFRTLTGAGGEGPTTRDRASCCLFYTLRPEDTCVTCPRMSEAERVARLCGGG